MDDSGSASLFITMILLAIYALITLAYAALANTRQAVLEDDAEEGNRAAQSALRLLKNESRLALTYHLTTLVIYTTAFTLLAATFVVPVFTSLDTVNEFVVVLGMLIGVLLFLLLGSVVPESIGSAHSRASLPFAVMIFKGLTLLSYPFVSFLLITSRIIARAFGAEKHVNMVTEEEIMTLVNAGLSGGTIENDEKAMIHSILQLDETTARELMSPRPDIVALETTADVTEALHAFIDSGFSRIPVYEDNIDSIVGLLYAKDLLELWRDGHPQTNQTIRDLLRSPFFVPETKRADELLREMRVSKVHVAIVLDEYGGTSGLVTIENLIEEIVGDIVDEYDVEEDEIHQTGENEYIVDAGIDIDDLNQVLDIDLDSDETDTLGGLIYMSLGRVPVVGDIVEMDEVILHVRSIDRRRIRNVALTLKVPSNDDGDSSTELPDNNAKSSEELADAS